MATLATTPTTSHGQGERDIRVTYSGHCMCDDGLNLSDVTLFAQAFGTSEGDPNWNPGADYRPDGVSAILREMWLNPREREIVVLVARGLTNDEIASEGAAVQADARSGAGGGSPSRAW